MNGFFIFIIACLATFRLALMFAEEEGPLMAFSLMRKKVPAKTNAGRGVRCINCVSAWVAMFLTAWLYWMGQVDAWMVPAYWLGLSGGSVIINRVTS